MRRGMGRYLKANYPFPLKGVEVGVNKGDHAGMLYHGLNIDTLWLVDIWGPYSSHLASTDSQSRIINKRGDYKRVLDLFMQYPNVGVVREESTCVAKWFPDGHLDFVYIDACHNYESVKEDIKAWLPKVKKGGVLGGHDYNTVWIGVKKAVDEAFPVGLTVDNTDWWWICT